MNWKSIISDEDYELAKLELTNYINYIPDDNYREARLFLLFIKENYIGWQGTDIPVNPAG